MTKSEETKLILGIWSLKFIWNVLFGHWNFSIRGCTKWAEPSEILTIINKKLYALNPLFFDESKKQFVLGHARGGGWLHVSFSAVYYDLLDYIRRELSN
jgi:hypothetical protein